MNISVILKNGNYLDGNLRLAIIEASKRDELVTKVCDAVINILEVKKKKDTRIIVVEVAK